MLGRESLALQGFPIGVLDVMQALVRREEDKLTERLFGDLAGNMVSTPVMLAVVMATMTVLDWRPPVEVLEEAVAAAAHEEIEDEPAATGIDEVEVKTEEMPGSDGGVLSTDEGLMMAAAPPPPAKRGGILSRVVTAPALGVVVLGTGPALVF